MTAPLLSPRQTALALLPPVQQLACQARPRLRLQLLSGRLQAASGWWGAPASGPCQATMSCTVAAAEPAVPAAPPVAASPAHLLLPLPPPPLLVLLLVQALPASLLLLLLPLLL